MPTTSANAYKGTTITYAYLHGTSDLIVEYSSDRTINGHYSVVNCNHWGKLYQAAKNGFLGVIESSGDVYDCESFYILESGIYQKQSYDLSFLSTVRNNYVTIEPYLVYGGDEIDMHFKVSSQTLPYVWGTNKHSYTAYGDTIQTALKNLDKKLTDLSSKNVCSLSKDYYLDFLIHNVTK